MSSNHASIAVSALGLLFLLGACGSSKSDLNSELEHKSDAQPEDALCESDAECKDDKFCNGQEICDPGSKMADDLGCVPGNTPKCNSGERCDEESESCAEINCASPDADGDGHEATECGGNDCDDGNPNRFPGAEEVCDAANIDEDCDETTLGAASDDEDGDGYFPPTCCNGTTCGDDCDDTRVDAHPGVTETCNRADDDCDGVIDNGFEDSLFFADCDGDDYGSLNANSDASCQMPVGPPPSCGGAPTAKWVSVAQDCNDADASRYPGQTEHCNSIDDDCNGQVDDGAGTQCALAAGANSMGCNLGSCIVAECTLGLADCGGGSDGCETDVSSDYQRCGGCESACSVEFACVDAQCDAAVSLSLGTSSTCILRASGTVSCFGHNGVGQLGNGSTLNDGQDDDEWTFVDVDTDSLALTLEIGAVHGCIVTTTNQVECWGGDPFAQLGAGSKQSQASPQLVPGLNQVIQVSAGGGHTCAVQSDGQAWCWGWNVNGALGDGTEQERSSPTMVIGLDDATAVTSGERHSCALRADHQVVCFGDNNDGQLGDGSKQDSSLFQRTITSLDADLRAIQIAAGAYHTCAISYEALTPNMGEVYCFGDNLDGQVGDSSTTDRSHAVTTGLTNVIQIAAGKAHSCALKESGQVYCWGNDYAGQLGDGSPDNISKVPTVVPGLSDAKAIYAGDNHSCALKKNNQVVCWGENTKGQLGLGDNNERTSPTAVKTP